jgi:hypothetical protein
MPVGFFVAGVKKNGNPDSSCSLLLVGDKAMNQYGDTLYQFGSLASQLAL